MAKNITPATILRRALKLFGPGGEHWVQGVYTDRFGGYCAIGALKKSGVSATGRVGPVYREAWKALRNAVGAVGYGIIDWNDDPRRTFPEVAKGFRKAIRLATPPKAPTT